jgi:hypothetical protein
VSRRGYGKKFGQTLNDGDDDGFKYVHSYVLMIFISPPLSGT